MITLGSLTAIVGGCTNDSGTTADPPAHPALECGEERSGTGNYDLVGPGFGTATAALHDRLSYYRSLYGGEIIELPNHEATLVVDGYTVVIATARPVPEGGFLVQEDYWCNSFPPQSNGTPSMEQPVEADS